MKWQPEEILSILDNCAESCSFPMLDNGYVYLAATRLSLYRSPEDWAMVIEVFGFSPRAGEPDTQIYTFGSRLQRQKTVEDYGSPAAFAAWLKNNPHNESSFISPIEAGDWQDPEDGELLATGRHTLQVRGKTLHTPAAADYAAHAIALEDSSRVHIFELCRLLAALERDAVLATPAERRVSVPAELVQIMQLEEWSHPDLVNDELPSANATLKSLAEVLASGQLAAYKTPEASNTDWRHWPDGGSL